MPTEEVVVPSPEAPVQAKTRPPELTDEVIHNAVRNIHPKSHVLGGRQFPMKDLSYDDYVEFIALVSPFIEGVFSMARPVIKHDEKAKTAALDYEFSFGDMGPATLINNAGSSLPRLAWLALRQSDPLLTVEDVKKLAGSPYPLAEIVLAQVAHNKLISAFSEFFQRAGGMVAALAPDIATVLAKMPGTIPATVSTT